METNTETTSPQPISAAEARRIERRKRLAEPAGTAFLRLVRSEERAADARSKAKRASR